MAAAQAIERRADDVLGVETRRLFYAEMLPGIADLLKPHIFRNTAPPHRLLGTAMWPKTRRILGQVFAATPTAAADSRARLGVELDWLDDRLADGRRFLVGDRFSRVDLTVASLLAFFARSRQADKYRAMPLPPALAEDVARWRTRPVMQWVNGIYQSHRGPRSKPA